MSHGTQKRISTNHPRIAILTSVETRHRFFANSVRSRFDVAVVVYARPTYAPAKVDDSDLSPVERAVVSEHFAERLRQEERYFGHDAGVISPSADCDVLHLEPGVLNTAQTAKSLCDRGVNTVVVFGTDLIKAPLLAPEKWMMINMHLGLSPYYRGTATNFYPLLNQEPEFVGATIHRLDTGIDSGPILQHARPEIDALDRPHTIGCKAIAAGISAMIEVLEAIERGEKMPGIPQWHEPNSRVYYRRDYHPRQVVELYQKWNEGLLERFLSEQRPAPRLVRRTSTKTGDISVRRRAACEVEA
jgi:methionyl-tRNA formyltransferase